MPSDLSYWLISAPQKGGDDQALFRAIKTTVGDNVAVGGIEIPDLKAGTLSNLLTLSDLLPKYDASFTQTVSKLLDTIRSLVESQSSSSSSSSSNSKTATEDIRSKLQNYLRVNDRSAEEYVMPLKGTNEGWKWDRSRWGSGGKVADVVAALNKEMTSIDSIQKQKLQSYNLAKGTLIQLQRKRVGNLSTKSLIGIVKKEDVVPDSEYLETLLVAVPKNAEKDWLGKYERLTSMIVPRSSSKLAVDDEYVLYTVTIFKKVKDEFLHKCRENKFIAREFKYDETAVAKQQEEIESAGLEEKELWTDLLRVSRTNFSEAYQLLVHLKVIRLFVESVLRYGLPAEYSALVVRPDPKTSLKTLKSLSSYFTFLSASSSESKARSASKNAGSGGTDEVGGEWGAVMEQEYFDFVLFEIPHVIY